MKKLIILILILFPINIYADSGRSTVVMDIDSGRIVYSKNMYEKKLIASTTKIMTCILVLENMNLDKEIIVGEEVLSMYGTNIYLEVGEKIKVRDLLYGLMLRSGNDAALTLAINTFGTEESFVKKMNSKAQEIGMKDTIFNNPHGLDDKTYNYSTAYDMALLSKYAYQNKNYRKIIATKKYITKSSIKSYVWYNRVELLNKYKYSLGGKNGYTPKAGKTLVSVASKDDLTYTIVSLDDNDIYNNHRYLYEKYFAKYKKFLIVDKDKFLKNPNLIKENLYIKKSFYYPLRKDEETEVVTLIKIFNEKNNQKVGEITIKLENNEIGKLNIYKQINKKEDISIFSKFKKLFVR